MINIHQAIYSLNQSIATIRGNVAYDIDGNEITYDSELAQAKLSEMQNAEDVAKQEQIIAKQSALSKLTALGLTPDEVKALLGK